MKFDENVANIIDEKRSPKSHFFIEASILSKTNKPCRNRFTEIDLGNNPMPFVLIFRNGNLLFAS